MSGTQPTRRVPDLNASDQRHDPAAAPAKDAPFAAKLAFYRAEHRSRGVRLTHLVGIPTVACSLPLVLARPRIGIPLFAAGWSLQVAGHVLFEHNRPALTRGPITYQLCGLAHWCEEIGDLLAGPARTSDVRAASPEADAGVSGG
ncbi:DUF962 domain-containing protein [Candidatus Frankia nodulisporulans]|uniref:DUF962 domain-containing protein n=1 Tax=Candidatus Frankia nodulisporulans TaxID=2060052 RepID=UPI0013CF6737|nr:DUF962 domain-containing protein [Candidatus Frankia nodulisporulans]